METHTSKDGNTSAVDTPAAVSWELADMLVLELRVTFRQRSSSLALRQHVRTCVEALREERAKKDTH